MTPLSTRDGDNGCDESTGVRAHRSHGRAGAASDRRQRPRRRHLLQPSSRTELLFLAEATAFAAGLRPRSSDLHTHACWKGCCAGSRVGSRVEPSPIRMGALSGVGLPRPADHDTR